MILREDLAAELTEWECWLSLAAGQSGQRQRQIQRQREKNKDRDKDREKNKDKDKDKGKNNHMNHHRIWYSHHQLFNQDLNTITPRIRPLPISIPFERFHQMALEAKDSNWTDLKVWWPRLMMPLQGALCFIDSSCIIDWYWWNVVDSQFSGLIPQSQGMSHSLSDHKESLSFIILSKPQGVSHTSLTGDPWSWQAWLHQGLGQQVTS